MSNHVSPFNETTDGFFILQNFWPLFKFFQILGFFPCKKFTDEAGVIQLRPMKIWMSIICLSTWLVVFYLPAVVFLFNLDHQSGKVITYFSSTLKDGGAKDGKYE